MISGRGALHRCGAILSAGALLLVLSAGSAGSATWPTVAGGRFARVAMSPCAGIAPAIARVRHWRADITVAFRARRHRKTSSTGGGYHESTAAFDETASATLQFSDTVPPTQALQALDLSMIAGRGAVAGSVHDMIDTISHDISGVERRTSETIRGGDHVQLPPRGPQDALPALPDTLTWTFGGSGTYGGYPAHQCTYGFTVTFRATVDDVGDDPIVGARKYATFAYLAVADIPLSGVFPLRGSVQTPLKGDIIAAPPLFTSFKAVSCWRPTLDKPEYATVTWSITPGDSAAPDATCAPTRSDGPCGADTYYLALGDSLAYGYQPTQGPYRTPVDPGYAIILFDHDIKPRGLATQQINYGCVGESTGTFLDGRCPQAGVFPLLSAYPEGCATPNPRQMCAATTFLRQHRRTVGLVTLDIGANDLLNIIPQARPGSPPPCAFGADGRVARSLAAQQRVFDRALAQFEANLTRILQGLVPLIPRGRLVLLDLPYDPFENLRNPTQGTTNALAWTDFLAFNRALVALAARFHVPIADVFAKGFGGSHLGADPSDINPLVGAAGQRSGALTWMPYYGTSNLNGLSYQCDTYVQLVPAQAGCVHPTTAGYRVMAGILWQCHIGMAGSCAAASPASTKALLVGERTR